jgi:hypothetical protein
MAPPELPGGVRERFPWKRFERDCLWRILVQHFWTCSGPTGSGKTFAATTFACERVGRNIKCVFIQPTIALCKQSYTDARRRFPDTRNRVRAIVTRRGSNDKIAHRLTSYLNDRDESGDLLFATQAGFLRTPHWHRADTWHLFVDEAMEVAYYRAFRLRKYRHLLVDLFHVRQSRHERYGILEARDYGQLDEALAQMKDDEIYEHFAGFIWRLRHGHWNLFVDHVAFQKFQTGETYTLEVHGLLAPTIFGSFGSVTLMGANLADSIMYKYFTNEGCTFSNHGAINRGLRYQDHANGSRLLIKYLTEHKWSKTLRNRIVHQQDADRDILGDVCDLYMELCQKEAGNHSTLAPLWIGNNDIRNEEFDGERLKNVPHGMNSYMMHEVCCIFSALNPPQAHRKFLQDLCGMSERQVRRALLSQTAYQSCGRGILRDPSNTGIFLLIVPDRDTAEDIASYYPGCRIEKLASDIQEPKTGRPSKYGSDVERFAAKREQNRASQRRVRKKSLYLSDSSDMSRTPDQIRVAIAHVLTEWAELSPDTKEASGFSHSDWASTSDRYGQGGSMFINTTDMLSDLQRQQHVIRVCKEASLLTCSTVFGSPPRLPDHLVAIGISIEMSIRSKRNAIGCRGYWFDIENGDMLPEDFARVFPNLEFIAYSSWSHRPDAPRYRIGIPSAQFVRPDIHALILHTIVDRLEAAGWGDALTDGRKHGVDVSKLHEAAMFYLPSKRPDCFLTHFRDGRQPLDPRQWINLIQDDLLISQPPPVPPEIYHRADEPANKDKQVQWAIDYWRMVGCVKSKGRTQLWLLAKRLAEAGCDDREMRDILWEQAGFATNPVERRGEIERLLIDPQMLATRCAA